MSCYCHNVFDALFLKVGQMNAFISRCCVPTPPLFPSGNGRLGLPDLKHKVPVSDFMLGLTFLQK